MRGEVTLLPFACATPQWTLNDSRISMGAKGSIHIELNNEQYTRVVNLDVL